MYNTDLPTRAELPSSKQLLRSTAVAAVAAIAILVTVVLPAEYGIDPTGIGRPLGLTEMGELKMQLAAIGTAAVPLANKASSPPSSMEPMAGSGATAPAAMSASRCARRAITRASSAPEGGPPPASAGGDRHGA